MIMEIRFCIRENLKKTKNLFNKETRTLLIYHMIRAKSNIKFELSPNFQDLVDTYTYT